MRQQESHSLEKRADEVLGELPFGDEGDRQGFDEGQFVCDV